ncbi:MAG TPA: ROK family protein, partial [Anaerolineaceae bacterium]
MERYGGIEAGGTKFVCLVASGPGAVFAETRFPTTDPEETLHRATMFFREQLREAPLAGIGVGSFGPLDLDPASPTYGSITTTPKPGWANTDLAGRLQEALQLPVVIDTDVNAAAYGEFMWGAAQGIEPFIYNTIGTGIGAGSVVNGRPVHGLLHPEGGHIRIPHDRAADPFPGICPYHGDCFEGLASGVALRERWGAPGETLPDDSPAWDLEAQYLALALVNQIFLLSPRRIVLGGGVMKHRELFPRVRRRVQEYLNGYIDMEEIRSGIDAYIVPPALED